MSKNNTCCAAVEEVPCAWPVALARADVASAPVLPCGVAAGGGHAFDVDAVGADAGLCAGVALPSRLGLAAVLSCERRYPSIRQHAIEAAAVSYRRTGCGHILRQLGLGLQGGVKAVQENVRRVRRNAAKRRCNQFTANSVATRGRSSRITVVARSIPIQASTAQALATPAKLRE